MDLPGFWVAILPVISVIALNALFTYVIIPQMNAGYLADPKYGATTLQSVAGIWAIIVALVAACVLILVLNWKRFGDVKESADPRLPLPTTPRLLRAEVVLTGTRMSVQHAEGRRLATERPHDPDQQGVLHAVGEVAGVEGVAIIQAGSPLSSGVAPSGAAPPGAEKSMRS